MEAFERELKSVPLARPGNELRGRIFEQEPVRLRFSDFLSSRIPVGWAAVLAICAGLLGMYVTESKNRESMGPHVVNVEKVIIEASSGENPFDFTSDDGMGYFLPGKMTVTASEEPARIL
jgi:hypothetical protein